ncbi:hypothetical protein AGDE_10587 [Angomonas deanei]|uniref:CTLH domain-containing protein n=1 Tax=Angomonas deanei TaxID=59799 RepID=A0A7G2CSC9_9TRYP|nr:hypothetical protein AGDE_10587 [Angomonas deanei]CAD2222696.1 hypothetical protein, conserved [Angomonas deanei]|eukprot:EPY28027.1 hypothetical protein AGDE_10587 [Angomonas deanei]
MTALELVDIAGAADLFSRQFASIPLPPRLHETVMQRCTSVLSQLTRDRSQAIISSQDEKMELEELSKRLKNVKAKPNTDAAPRRKKKAKKQESESDVIVLSSHVRQLVDEAFYINLNFIVELILRGDTKNAVQLISALFLGLEQEGGALYVAQAQAYIVDTLFFKLRHVGCLHAIEVAPPSPETSLAVEEALAATASALLVRVSQGLTRQLTQKATSTGETEKEHKSLGGASLLVVLVDLTASLLCCGMSADGVRQLNRLHTAILKTTLLAEGDAAVNPNTLVQKSIQTLTSIVSGFEARKLPFPRHHKSLAAQLTNLSINEIVSNHIGLLTEVIRKDDKRLTQLSLTTTLQTVKFLSNVLLQYPVTAEPSGIYSFRTEIMDPLLVTALRQKQIPLAQLSEIAFVMLREETVHLLSSEFLNRLSDRVIEASKQKGNDAHVSTSAFRLAQSFRVICQLSEAQYTQNFVRILEILDAHLTLLQCCTLLEKMLSTNGPADTPVGLRMYKRLVASLESQKVSLLLSDRILLLHAVVRYRVLYPKTATEHLVPLVTYMSKMLKRVPIRSYGALVALACDLHTVEPSAELMLLPRQVAALLLPQVQSCPIECVATTVAGYARLPESESPLKAQVLGVFISRITRVVQELSPEEITTCIEAYCKSGLFQPYFFGILLARLSDVTQLVTLEVAIRLLQCGIHSHREEIRTACITAAKPLFLIHVKTILQRDPNSLATVVTSSTLILHCLRDAFPREPVASQVLEAIALHHHVARLPIMVATLQLIAERNGADLDVLRTLAEHSCTVLIPKCGAAEFAELFSLLVQCGVRSAQLLSAAKEKLKELTSGKSSALDGHSLATLAGSLQVAFMEVDTVLLQLISEQVTAVCKKASSGKSSAAGRATPFTLRGVSVILQLYYSAGEAHVFPLQGSVDGLLHYAVQHWRTADGLATLRPNDLYVLLRACKEASSGLKPHLPLVDLCAEGIQSQLSSTDCLKQWEDMDLLHVGQLLHILLACAPRMAKHPSVKLLLELIYKKKALLLQRQLVKEEVQKVLRQCGKEAHPELWELLGMDSKSK